jgi:hypothetical protein
MTGEGSTLRIGKAVSSERVFDVDANVVDVRLSKGKEECRREVGSADVTRFKMPA